MTTKSDAASTALKRAYVESYRGPQGDAPVIGDSGLTAPIRVRAQHVLTQAVLEAHRQLGSARTAGSINIATYAEDDSRGFGPALQVVTDEAPMLMESVTVLLNRLHVAYVSIMCPVFRVRRNSDGVLEDIAPAAGGDGIDEAWIHVELADGVDAKALKEIERQLPSVITDAQQVARDSAAMRDALRTLADTLDNDTYGRFPAKQRHEVARLLRWLDDGHFVLVGYQRCSVNYGCAEVDDASRLG